MKLIDADAFSNVMKKRQDACSEWVKEAKGNYRYRALGAWSILSEIKLTLDKIPSIDAVEVVHGEWINKYPLSTCSVCSATMILNDYSNYCPNCGAKMDGKEKNDECTDCM